MFLFNLLLCTVYIFNHCSNNSIDIHRRIMILWFVAGGINRLNQMEPFYWRKKKKNDDDDDIYYLTGRLAFG